MTAPAPIPSPPQLPEHMERSLAADVACDLYESEDIGNRYGLGGKAGLKAYLRDRPKLFAAIQEARAINNGALGADERLRLKNTLAAEEVVHHMARVVADPNSTPGQKTEAYDKLLKGSGITAIPKQAQGGGAGGQSGPPFMVNFFFSGHPPERISTTVVDADIVPPPSADIPAALEAP